MHTGEIYKRSVDQSVLLLDKLEDRKHLEVWVGVVLDDENTLKPFRYCVVQVPKDKKKGGTKGGVS